MDEEAERRGMDRLGAPRPLLEGQVRRAAEGIERDRAEIARQCVDDAPAPPVERMLDAVARLVARGEGVPARAPGHADEDDRADVRERPCPLVVGETEGAARDEAGALDGGKDSSIDMRARASAVTIDDRSHGIPEPASIGLRAHAIAGQTAQPRRAAPRPEADLGRRLCRTERGRLSREPAHRRPVESRASARRSALGADLPGGRARGGERTASRHLGRLTVNLLRPAPVGECRIEAAADYVGRNAGHFSGRLTAGDKEIARFTALMQREEDARQFPTERRAIRRPRRRSRSIESPVVTMAFDHGVRLRRPGREPARGGAVLRRPLRRLVPIEPSAGQGRGAEPLPARRGRRRFRQRHQRVARLQALSLRQQRPDDQPLPPPGREWICLQSSELVRRQRLRPGGIGALRRGGPDRTRDARAWR